MHSEAPAQHLQNCPGPLPVNGQTEKLLSEVLGPRNIAEFRFFYHIFLAFAFS
jgi:hypothetical protein